MLYRLVLKLRDEKDDGKRFIESSFLFSFLSCLHPIFSFINSLSNKKISHEERERILSSLPLAVKGDCDLPGPEEMFCLIIVEIYLLYDVRII